MDRNNQQKIFEFLVADTKCLVKNDKNQEIQCECNDKREKINKMILASGNHKYCSEFMSKNVTAEGPKDQKRCQGILPSTGEPCYCEKETDFSKFLRENFATEEKYKRDLEKAKISGNIEAEEPTWTRSAEISNAITMGLQIRKMGHVKVLERKGRKNVGTGGFL